MTVVKIRTEDEFDELLIDNEDKLIVVDFYASWCGPCKRIEPTIEEFAKKYDPKLLIIKVNVDDFDELTHEYEVKAMPTFKFIQKQKVVSTLVGSNEKELETKIKRFIYF